jgi:rhodanese-related sulfurtransferase
MTAPIIDVREPYEFKIVEMGGELIPQGDITKCLDRIPMDQPVVIQCRSGKRSANVIRILEDEHGYKNLVNLKGGILAWQEEIQNGLARY